MTTDTFTADQITRWQHRRHEAGLDAIDHTCYPADPDDPMSRCRHPHKPRRRQPWDEIADREAVDGENRYEEYMGLGER